MVNKRWRGDVAIYFILQGTRSMLLVTKATAEDTGLDFLIIVFFTTQSDHQTF